MGMFDYVRCEVPLPDGWVPDELQSKDFDCTMTHLRVTADGRLMIERYESYTVPKEERPYPDAEEGSIQEICGIWGKRNRRWEDINYHGDFNFYGIERVGPQEFVPLTEGAKVGYYKGETCYHDYIARFTDGRLTGIVVSSDSDTRPKDGDKGTLGSTRE
jgi:hypothetical protein